MRDRVMRSWTPGLLAVALMLGLGVPTTDAAEQVDVAAEAAAIDRLVAAGLDRNGVVANEPADDATFLRRVYLDLAGRIPTYEETSAFLDSRDPQKRAKLIDALIGSEAYVSHQYNFWADILRIKSRLTNQVRGDNYAAYVKEAVRENKPYDAFVRELLTAEGRVDDNGASGYFLRDSGMPLDNTANTVRIFLGTQIGCAQCHDHPFDKWTQHEFYEMAAYTFGVQTRKRPENQRDLRNEAQKAGLSPRQQQVLRRIVQVSTNQVYENKYKTLKLPDDYKYEDAKPNDKVEPYAMFGDEAAVGKGDSPRVVFADWLTDKQNPRFAVTIANRLWAEAFGVGIIDPIDDMRDNSVASNPELLEHLTKLMRRLDFDLQAYQRIVYNTKAYQRTASRYELEPGQPYYFQGPTLRRMSAEQIWDSVVTLIIPSPDERPGSNAANNRQMMVAAALDKDPDELDVFNMSAKELVAAVKRLPDDPRKADREMRMKVREKMLAQMRDPEIAQWRGYPRDMVRASELESPARPGHFLQEFGQSDREIIENASTDPSVTQVLTMLNGPIEKQVLGNERSMLVRHVQAAADPGERVRVIFRSMFNRDPFPAELGASLNVIQEAGEKAGYRDLVWALFNTREFIFIQ